MRPLQSPSSPPRSRPTSTSSSTRPSSWSTSGRPRRSTACSTRSAASGSRSCGDTAVDEPSTGETIDPAARRHYEQRIRDLQVDIDEAEANSDYARAYRHHDELDQLIEHLTAAIGRGGRTRRAAGSTERARSAVTHRVKAAIRQITKLRPQLGTHLARAVNTGTYCSYRPEQPTTWLVS